MNYSFAISLIVSYKEKVEERIGKVYSTNESIRVSFSVFNKHDMLKVFCGSNLLVKEITMTIPGLSADKILTRLI